MKGEIFNIFEQFITDNFSADTFDSIHDDAKSKLVTQEPFVGPGTYPDADFFALVVSAVAILKLQLGSAVKAFGKYCFPRLASKVQEHIANVRRPAELLTILDGLIHVEVRKLYAGARPPRFTVLASQGDYIKVRYQSSRKLYDFVEGIIEGAANFYGFEASIVRQLIDADSGTCDFEITFRKRS